MNAFSSFYFLFFSYLFVLQLLLEVSNTALGLMLYFWGSARHMINELTFKEKLQRETFAPVNICCSSSLHFKHGSMENKSRRLLKPPVSAKSDVGWTLNVTSPVF